MLLDGLPQRLDALIAWYFQTFILDVDLAQRFDDSARRSDSCGRIRLDIVQGSLDARGLPSPRP